MKIWLLAILLFAFAISLRLWNLNEMGRWSDESALVDKGYTVIELIKKGDFNNSFWYYEASGHPILSTYFYGLASYKDFIMYETGTKHYFSAWAGGPVFTYDLTYSRLVSVVISSLAVVLVFFIGVYYFSIFTGIVAAIILAMLPHFLGYSQLVTYESWVVPFFTACAFSYYLYLEKNKRILLVLTGVLTGLTLEVKESTGIILALYVGTYILWRTITKKKNISLWHLFWICLIGFLTYFLIWPMPLLHLSVYASFVNDLWLKNGGLTPELIFGRYMGAHAFYYLLALVITTPLIILLLTVAGIKVAINKKKNWIFPAVVLWFFIPFLMMFFHHRQNMVRYIIEIYAPLSLLAALGFERLITFFTKSRFIKYCLIAPLFVYLLFLLVSITPYYLAYYNELVGGTKNVYEKKLFLLGWFGEGLRGPGIYVANNAPKNATVGLATDPYTITAVYTSPYLHYEQFDTKKSYDYVILNYYKVIRLRFDEEILKKNYNLVYTEKADGIDYVRVYKHK